ncbi:PepSY1/2 domain-containing protein [Caldalkalibacillus mannanilyticus]|uniref:PepSY1/2 domain-containing protein n=1 Tax=Caldalkalibacillus mannanilyticus TaxID=1418 RepID=UPI00046973D6|nr:PepSY1/2 domain-containing protein [Caldalkalibacillus mannanilyticus]
MKFKKLGALTLTAAIAMSAVAPAAYAETVANPSSSVKETVVETIEKDPEIQAELLDNVPKDKMIKRINEIFPDQFTFLEESDFRVDSERYYYYGGFKDEVERYSLSFDKEISRGKYVHGSFGFVGSELKLSHFYYTGKDVKEAYYPAKVNQDQAQEIAQTFINKVTSGAKYEVVESPYYYDSTNKTLTEPIRYNFSFERNQNGVPVRGLGGHVEVLGNGEIVGFWAGDDGQKVTFEPKRSLIGEEKALEQIKEKLNLELRYVSDYDYRKNETNLYLSYVPVPGIGGVQATSGKWYVDGKFVDELPGVEKVKMLTETKKDVKTKAITLKEAKAMAEELLKTDEEGMKLVVHGVHEYTNHMNKTVYSVDYMYESANHGYGGSLEISKDTGEILSYHNYNFRHFEPGAKEPEVKVSYEEALEKAVKYVEKYAPAAMHKYAYPTMKLERDEYSNGYHISFPRVENGIEFLGDGITVSISAEDGSLQSFYNSTGDYKEIPSPDKAVDLEVAKSAFFENLELKLVYANEWSKDKMNDYKLVYEMNYSPTPFGGYFDAVTGEWKAPSFAPEVKEVTEKPVIKHAWAENELNFMLEAKILTIKDKENFNPDAVVSKGDALEILMKSLTRFWEGEMPYFRGEEPKATFDNIGVDHPLFTVVERAVQMGILDRDATTFDLDAKLTREELASWYVKALRLNEAAKHSQIYHVDFKDADKIDPKYKGHVALASAFGILTGANEKFSPTQEVTLAQMAVATFRMANTINTINYDNGRDYYYFW